MNENPTVNLETYHLLNSLNPGTLLDFLLTSYGTLANRTA